MFGQQQSKPVVNAVVTFRDGRQFEVQFEKTDAPPVEPGKLYTFRTLAHGNELFAMGDSISYLQVIGDSNEVDNAVGE